MDFRSLYFAVEDAALMSLRAPSLTEINATGEHMEMDLEQGSCALRAFVQQYPRPLTFLFQPGLIGRHFLPPGFYEPEA